jgi:hypothetical protein
MKLPFKITLLLLAGVQVYCQEVKVFKSENVSVGCPADWVRKDNIPPNYLLVINEPMEGDFKVMTTFDVHTATGFLTIDDYCDFYCKKMMSDQTFLEFKVDSKKRVSYKDFSAIQLECSAKIYYSMLPIPMEWRSYILLKDQVIYEVTITALAGNLYVQKEMIDKIFDSVVIE